MKRICLVTHTQATHSVNGQVGGWFDSELTEPGRAQAASLREKIKAHGFELEKLKVYSSDLKRAVQTTEALGAGLALDVRYDTRLREMSFGRHEGMEQAAHDELMQPVSATGERLDHRICDGAESRREVAARIAACVQEIMHQPGDALIVTHGFAATFVIAAFQQIDIESMGYIAFKVNPGSVSILEADDLFQNRAVCLLNG